MVTEEIKKVVLKTTEPIGIKKKPSLFSINATLEKIEVKEEDIGNSPKIDGPSQHFTETDLQKEWQLFLKQIQETDMIVYNAINSFSLHKKNEDIIEITYPSESSKIEFEKVRAEFFNHFKHKVNHFNIIIEFRLDRSLKKEIVTKRKIFDKFAEINPVLKELDHLFKLDFN